MKQAKAGAEIEIPVHRDLCVILDVVPRRASDRVKSKKKAPRRKGYGALEVLRSRARNRRITELAYNRLMRYGCEAPA